MFVRWITKTNTMYQGHSYKGFKYTTMVNSVNFRLYNNYGYVSHTVHPMSRFMIGAIILHVGRNMMNADIT